MPALLCPLCGNNRPVFDCKALLYADHIRDIFHCPDCDARYFWPIPTPDEIAKCYPHAYFQDFYNQYWKDRYKGQALANGIVRWRRQGTFLDVGCALGTLAAGFRDASTWEVRGLEYMPAAVRAGQELNKLEIAQGGITSAPWPAGSLDYIHANNVLEHESDPSAALRAAARLLKPGGRLHLTLPNGRMDVLPNQILFRRLGRPVRTRHSGHLFFYSAATLRRLLAQTGFRILWLKGFHFKTALKARGLMPGAYRHFYQQENDHAAETPAAGLPSNYRQRIPPPPSRLLYDVKTRLRRMWRWPNATWGYDFEILAERET